MDVLIFLIFILLVCLALFAAVKSGQQSKDARGIGLKEVGAIEQENKPVFQLKRGEQSPPPEALRLQPTPANAGSKVNGFGKKKDNVNPMARCRVTAKPKTECRHCRAMKQNNDTK